MTLLTGLPWLPKEMEGQKQRDQKANSGSDQRAEVEVIVSDQIRIFNTNAWGIRCGI